MVPKFASCTPSSQWLYTITFGGGLVEGDNITLDVDVGEDCTVVVTTQASTKVYRPVYIVLTVKVDIYTKFALKLINKLPLYRPYANMAAAN